MSASPIPMMTAATASLTGAASSDVAPETASAFSAMVVSAGAQTADGQSSSSDAKAPSKTDTPPADEAGTTDGATIDKEGGLAANLLSGAALYILQPQPTPTPTGETDVAVDASTGSIPVPLPAAPPEPAAPLISNADLQARSAPQLGSAQTFVDQNPAGAVPLPAATSLADARLTPVSDATAEAGATLETSQPINKDPAGAGKAPQPGMLEPASIAAAPVRSKLADNEAAANDIAKVVSAAIADAASASAPAPAMIAATTQQAPGPRPSAGKLAADKAAAAALLAPSETSATLDEPSAPEDAPVINAAPAPSTKASAQPQLATAPTLSSGPTPTQSVAEPGAPLRASNASASDKAVSAGSTTESVAGAALTPSASTTPAISPATSPMVTAAQAVAISADAGPAILPDVIASASPEALLSSAPAPAAVSGDTVAAAVTQSLSSLSRATIETTAQIAAQITRRLEGRSTRFEMKLAPEGLGNVDVSIDIGADGQLAARLAFDNPLAATELRGRADELRRQLEDAGFTIARDALDFAERDPSSAGGDGFDRRQNNRAFSNASRLAAEADAAIPPPSAWVSLSLTPRGVDMKV